MANALATQKPQTGFVAYVGKDNIRKNIEDVVGKENTNRFLTPIVASIQANPQLAECTPSSILSGGLEIYSLGLAPSTKLGQAYLVPHNTRKKIGNQWTDMKEATFVLGWKGYVQLAERSGQYRTITVKVVKEGEIGSYNPITDEISFNPIEDYAPREKAKTVGYFARFELMNGFEKQLFSTVEAMQSHAYRYSSAYRYDRDNGKKTCPWSTDFDSMAMKTMIRQLLGKWGIMSIEMQRGYINDMGVIDDDGQVRYVDNPQAVDVEVKVQEDIEANANKVEFVEEPEILPAPETPTEPVVEPEKPKRGRPAKTAPAPTPAPVRASAPTPVPEPEIAPTVIDISDDDAPEWG